MQKIPTNSKINLGGGYTLIRSTHTSNSKYFNKAKAFTLIELLVVIAIIGILAGVVIASLNSAREKGRVASLKSTLKNLQTQAQLYHLDNGTFAGLCTYNKTGLSPHPSIQPMIDALTSIAGSGNVRCVVRTSNVPAGSTHFVADDSLETKNFGVAVYYNERHYGVDATGVITLDESDTTSPSATQNFTTANNTCISLGKRLPSIEILKAINDYGAEGGGLDFLLGTYWSSTPSASSSSYAYLQYFINGGVYRNDVSDARYVRCGS